MEHGNFTLFFIIRPIVGVLLSLTRHKHASVINDRRLTIAASKMLHATESYINPR